MLRRSALCWAGVCSAQTSVSQKTGGAGSTTLGALTVREQRDDLVQLVLVEIRRVRHVGCNQQGRRQRQHLESAAQACLSCGDGAAACTLLGGAANFPPVLKRGPRSRSRQLKFVGALIATCGTKADHCRSAQSSEPASG